MTDRELVIDGFVDKYYQLGEVSNDYKAIPFGITLKDGNLDEINKLLVNEFNSIDNFVEHVTGLYSDFYTDEDKYLTVILFDWFNDLYLEMYSNIYGYLDGNVKVELGVRSWETKVNGNSWTCKELINEFGKEYSESTIMAIYNNWHSEEVLRVSEENMKSMFG